MKETEDTATHLDLANPESGTSLELDDRLRGSVSALYPDHVASLALVRPCHQQNLGTTMLRDTTMNWDTAKLRDMKWDTAELRDTAMLRDTNMKCGATEIRDTVVQWDTAEFRDTMMKSNATELRDKTIK